MDSEYFLAFRVIPVCYGVGEFMVNFRDTPKRPNVYFIVIC